MGFIENTIVIYMRMCVCISVRVHTYACKIYKFLEYANFFEEKFYVIKHIFCKLLIFNELQRK